MSRRNTFAGFAAGLLAGAVGTIALMGGHAVPRAMGQVASAPEPAPPPPPSPPLGASPRYQISSWAHPASPGAPAAQGAYILDTQTGQMWLILGRGGAQLIKVGKVGPE